MQALNNQTVSATKLVFDSTERWILGPQLTLDHCHIVLKGSTWRTLQLRDVRLVDCTIEASTELKDFKKVRMEILEHGPILNTQRRQIWNGLMSVQQKFLTGRYLLIKSLKTEKALVIIGKKMMMAIGYISRKFPRYIKKGP